MQVSFVGILDVELIFLTVHDDQTCSSGSTAATISLRIVLRFEGRWRRRKSVYLGTVGSISSERRSLTLSCSMESMEVELHWRDLLTGFHGYHTYGM